MNRKIIKVLSVMLAVILTFTVSPWIVFASSCDVHGHSYSRSVQIPTCTDYGYTADVCRDCGYSCVSNEAPLGHNIINGVCDKCNGYGVTSLDAMAWCQSQLGKTLDYDGAYGGQCVDLIMYYYQHLGVSPVGGNACDYTTNSLPSGWEIIQDGKPQMGDILVYTGGYGHVAIYESENVSYHQNWSGQYVEKVNRPYYQGYTNDDVSVTYWGCIRPSLAFETGWFDDYCVIYGNEHNYEIWVTTSTCTEEGSTKYRCKVCGTTDVGRTPAKGHTIVDGVCIVCGSENTDDCVNGDGHNYKGYITAPTCTSYGYTTYTCSDCGHSYVSNKVPATGHTIVNGVCTICGSESTGDSTEDEKVDQYFAFENSDYRQMHIIRDYSTKYDAYAKQYFDGVGIPMDGTGGMQDYCVPGLFVDDNLVPQGIAYYPQKDWILISAYYHTDSGEEKNVPSVILALDKDTGKYVAQFNIYNKNKAPHTGHVGGIAVSDYNLYLSYGKSIAYIPLSELNVSIGTVKNITIEDTKSLSSQLGEASVSYVTFTDGVLYAGNFYNTKKADYKKRASKDYASVIVGYTLAGTGSNTEWEDWSRTSLSSENEWNNLNISSPSHKYNISDDSGIIEIQNATVKDGYLYMSCSYGRTNDSTLYIKNVGSAMFTNIYKEDESCMALPMMEGITFIDGYMYTIFESASYYYNGFKPKKLAKNPTDVVWRINYKKLIDNNSSSSDVSDKTVPYKDGSVKISFKQNWFSNDSVAYNHSLAQLSSQFIMLGYDYTSLNNALETIGMSGIQMEAVPDEDKVDYFIANRRVTVNGNEYTLIFTGLIGTNTVQWYSNFDPGLGSTHSSFNKAKEYVIGKLNDYVDNLGVNKSKVKILLCGHSRGGATANLVGAQLIKDENLALKENVYTYTFATPNPTSLSERYDVEYKRIFNIVNPEDFVTKCLPFAWGGYGRYGTTYTLPSKTNTSSSTYQSYLNKMRSYYSQFTDEKKYSPYSNGEEATYIVVKNLTDSITNLSEFYVKDLEAGYVGDMSPWEFFQTTLCPFVAKNSGLYEYSTAVSNITSIKLSSSKVYKSIVNYFIKDQALNGAFEEAHCAETYCAYMMSMSSSQLTAYRKSYKNTVNCPVDIEVYDKVTGELVGRIINNVVDEEIAAKENSIVMSVDGDSKSFWLPSDGEYDVKLIGNDNGTMDYTVAEVDGDSVETTRVNFVDVQITDNKAMSGDFNGEEFVLEEYSLTTEDGKTIESDDLITLDNADEYKFDVKISTVGKGFATGDGTFTKGDYVTVSASTDELNEFLGWYENGELVSTDVEYGFVAQSNVELTAKFTNNIPEPEYNYTFSIQSPSRTEIRNKDGIILHAVVDGTAPDGCYVRWESSNGNFDEDADGYNLEIIAKNKGYTTFTAILCAEDGTELARSSVEMYSKSGFFDKIGGFFRSLFGTTKVYDA